MYIYVWRAKGKAYGLILLLTHEDMNHLETSSIFASYTGCGMSVQNILLGSLAGPHPQIPAEGLGTLGAACEVSHDAVSVIMTLILPTLD